MSNLNKWDQLYKGDYERQMYSDDTTAKIAGFYFADIEIKTIEDWGCGFGGFKSYIKPEQQYVGIDGSPSKYADKIVDLETYQSNPDAIHMRHVLEHNLNWQKVLGNAMNSFQKKMVLTLFTPFTNVETIISDDPDFMGTGLRMVDISFELQRITALIDRYADGCLRLKTPTQYGQETMFFLMK